MNETEKGLTIDSFMKSALNLQKFVSSKHASIVQDFIAESSLAIFRLNQAMVANTQGLVSVMSIVLVFCHDKLLLR